MKMLLILAVLGLLFYLIRKGGGFGFLPLGFRSGEMVGMYSEEHTVE